MNGTKKLVAAGAAVLAVSGLSAGAIAQQPQTEQSQPGIASPMGPWMMARGGMTGGWGMWSWMTGENDQDAPACARMASNIEGRLAFLKAELKITQAQEPLWAAYVLAARDNAKNMLARCTAMMGNKEAVALSLPERLDKREQFMEARLESLRTLNRAIKPLYAALDDTQKQAADELFRGPMGMM
ncbi:MAG: Spy/CpxP family protein refolding chaperone [Rhodomicrobium sp.]